MRTLFRQNPERNSANATENEVDNASESSMDQNVGVVLLGVDPLGGDLDTEDEETEQKPNTVTIRRISNRGDLDNVLQESRAASSNGNAQNEASTSRVNAPGKNRHRNGCI